MKLLITNDDGIASPGLHVLAAAFSGTGHDLSVVAPLTDRTGSGTAMAGCFGQSVRTETLGTALEVPLVGVDASPATVVTLARLGAFGDAPKCVVAGINPGANTGRAILHSGTVGAVLTAASLGMSGLAISIDSPTPSHLDTAARIGVLAMEWLRTARKRTVLNVNVPDLPLSQIKGVHWGRLAAFGRHRLVPAPSVDGGVAMVLERSPIPPDPETDEGLLAAGCVSVTSITGIQAVHDESAAEALAQRTELFSQ